MIFPRREVRRPGAARRLVTFLARPRKVTKGRPPRCRAHCSAGAPALPDSMWRLRNSTLQGTHNVPCHGTRTVLVEISTSSRAARRATRGIESQTPNSKLQTPNSKLQTPNSKLQTPTPQFPTQPIPAGRPFAPANAPTASGNDCDSRITIAPRRLWKTRSSGLRKHEARHTAAAEEGIFVIEAGSNVLFRSADGNHQRQQMFFARMRNARRRGGFP
jgi:hypothetical protein